MPTSTTSPDRLRHLALTREVLRLRMEGKSVRQIATELTEKGSFGAVSRPRVGRILIAEVGRQESQVSWRADQIRNELTRKLLNAIELEYTKYLATGRGENLQNFLKVTERLAKQNGLDAPVKTQNTQLSVYASMSEEQLESLAKQRGIVLQIGVQHAPAAEQANLDEDTDRGRKVLGPSEFSVGDTGDNPV